MLSLITVRARPPRLLAPSHGAMEATIDIPKILAILVAQPRNANASIGRRPCMVLGQTDGRADLDQPLDVEVASLVLIVAETIDDAACKALLVVLGIAHNGQLHGRMQRHELTFVDAEVARAAGLDLFGFAAQ